MKKNGDISTLVKPIGHLFHKYHLTIFILFIVGCLVAAVLLLNTILDNASDQDEYKSSISAGSLDQSTLDRINSLHKSNDALPEAQAATGRSDPFYE